MNYLKDLIESKLDKPGRLISGSKGRYSFYNPQNVTIFNANLYNADKEKLWFGDIDLSTQDFEILKEVAIESGKFLFVLSEMDGRFEKENNPDLESAMYCFTPTGSFQISPQLQDYVGISDGRPFRKVEQSAPAWIPPTLNISGWVKVDVSSTLSTKFTSKYSPIDHLIKVVHSAVDKDSMQAIAWNANTENQFGEILEKYMRKVLKVDDEYEIHKAISWSKLDLPSEMKNGDDWCAYVKIKSN